MDRVLRFGAVCHRCDLPCVGGRSSRRRRLLASANAASVSGALAAATFCIVKMNPSYRGRGSRPLWNTVTYPCDLGKSAASRKLVPMDFCPPPRHSIASLRVQAFSLIELITLVAIISVVMAFLTPAYTSISSGKGLAQATTGIVGIVERSR
jgi:hypothetical protein